MTPKRSQLATTSLILAIGGLVLASLGETPASVMALLLGLLAALLGILAAALIRWGSTKKTGTRHAFAGVFIAAIATVLGITGIVNQSRTLFAPQGWQQRNRWVQVPEVPGRNSATRPPLTQFPTRLPVVILNTSGKSVWKEQDTIIRAEFYAAEHTSQLTPEKAEYAGPATLHVRGNSSARLPKQSFTLHLVDSETNQIKAPLLGLPKESDWVLYAPFEDKTLIRDVLAYDIARKMGHYAPRTRYVELFLNRSTGPASTLDYEGVYVLVEKIKRGPERVDITRIAPEDATEPAISGGYIIKRDHHEREGQRFHAGEGGPYFYVYPKEKDISSAQRAWLRRYLGDFEAALHGPDLANPEKGYAAYLDVDSFIDSHWLIEASKNVDGFRYSSFITKDRGGKLRTEPPWDWNRAFGNANYYGGWQTEGWYWPRLRPSEIDWYVQLKKDPIFQARAEARWRELRKTCLDPEIIGKRIDEFAAELEGAHQRNFDRWPILGHPVTCNYYVGRTHAEEVKWLKNWIRRRIEWIDGQVGADPNTARRIP